MTDSAVDKTDAPVDAAPPEPRQLALAVSGSRSSLRVFVATSTSFRKVFEVDDPLGYGNGVSWTDYDGDMCDDLVSSFAVPDMPGEYEMLILHNDGDSGISVVDGRGMNPSPLLGYDADADGDGDVYVATQGGSDLLFQSNGTQLSQYYSWSEPGNSSWEYGVAAGDMTGDGRPEVALARGLYGEAISLGTSGSPLPTWSRAATSDSESTDVAMVDWDGDGRLEAAFSKSNNSDTVGSIEVMSWNGTTFTSVYSTTEFAGVRALGWADFDANGVADLALCHAGSLWLYLRQGQTFTPHPINASDLSCLDFALGDYDADGDPDIALLGAASSITVYRNDANTLTSVFHDDSTQTNVLAWGRCAPGTTACFSLAPTL